MNFVRILGVNQWNRGIDFSSHGATNPVLGVLAVFTVGPLLVIAFGALPAHAPGLFFTFMAFALAQGVFSFVLLLGTSSLREFE